MPPFYVFFSLHRPSAVSALAKGLAAPIIILLEREKMLLPVCISIKDSLTKPRKEKEKGLFMFIPLAARLGFG